MRFALLLLGCATAGPLLAQGHASHDMTMASNPHMRTTPAWKPVPGDQARADSIAAIATDAVDKYRDIRVAEADGFKRFAPEVRNQPIYHYTRLSSAVKARFTFDPALPSSLLYREDSTGGMRLVGVMYTAPSGATLDELNARIPLSVARWHLHTNICLPAGGAGRNTLATSGAQFGFRGAVTTREACEAAGGRFREAMFGWMVHVNLFEPGTLGPWQDDDGGMRHH